MCSGVKGANTVRSGRVAPVVQLIPAVQGELIAAGNRSESVSECDCSGWPTMTGRSSHVRTQVDEAAKRSASE
jgi:hypothetical protein